MTKSVSYFDAIPFYPYPQPVKGWASDVSHSSHFEARWSRKGK